MKVKFEESRFRFAWAAAAIAIGTGFLYGQNTPVAPTNSQPAPPGQVQKTAPPPAPPQALNGTWKLNATKSDDPEEKMRGSTDLELPTEEANIPPGTQVAPSGGGRRGGGGTYTRGPLGGPNNAGLDVKGDQKMLDLLRPAASLTVEVKDGEFDLTDEKKQKRALFTDGRKLQKTKDESYKEIAARWLVGRLAFDEKGPRNEKITVTFQPVPDARQVIETTQIDKGSIYSPILIRYVYDFVPDSK